MYCLKKRSKNHLLGLLCAIAVIVGSPGNASQEADDFRVSFFRGFGCSGAISGDYDTLLKHITREEIGHPDYLIYIRASCPNAKLILQWALLLERNHFLRMFIRGVYLEHGEEEVAKIVNHRDRLFGNNLLEEAFILGECRDKASSEMGYIIGYLMKVGGKTRPDFMRYCREFLEGRKN